MRGDGWLESSRSARTFMTQQDAFPALEGGLLKGYVYAPDFLTAAEEAALIDQVRKLPLKEAEYKQFQAKHRIHSYGGRYDFSANRLLEAEPIAPFLYPLRERIAAWTGRAATDFAHALVAEYTPGTQLGWHRDVPHFELVVGVSLGSPCKMRSAAGPRAIARRGAGAEIHLPTGR
jgi:alkylated DNA repair dioxygenase AlkB